MKKDVKKKIALLGDPAVGKTSLIRRYVIDKYEDKYISTLGTKVTKKTITFNESHITTELTFIIWDVLGQKEFRKIQQAAIDGSKGALIVFDTTRPETFASLDFWMNAVNDSVGNIPIVLLGNKIDIVPDFDRTVADNVANDFDTIFLPTSAKTGQNVEKAFIELGQKML